MSDELFPPLAYVARAYASRFAEFAFEPGFVAAVDQHAADLRARLRSLHRGPVTERQAAEELSDYALGFLDALAELGWEEPVGHDYAVCRLTAICWLLREHRRLAPDAADDRPRET